MYASERRSRSASKRRPPNPLATMAREPVGDIELAQALSYLAGQARIRRQSGAAVAAEIVEAWLVGTGLEELDDPAAAYRGITAGALQELAGEYLDPSGRAEGVVRGAGRER